MSGTSDKRATLAPARAASCSQRTGRAGLVTHTAAFHIQLPWPARAGSLAHSSPLLPAWPAHTSPARRRSMVAAFTMPRRSMATARPSSCFTAAACSTEGRGQANMAEGL